MSSRVTSDELRQLRVECDSAIEESEFPAIRPMFILKLIDEITARRQLLTERGACAGCGMCPDCGYDHDCQCG